jgi:nitrous oxidase accessory protein NosD/pimeloyl-ACP methyl ester carboxylesterase
MDQIAWRVVQVASLSLAVIAFLFVPWITHGNTHKSTYSDEHLYNGFTDEWGTTFHISRHKADPFTVSSNIPIHLWGRAAASSLAFRLTATSSTAASIDLTVSNLKGDTPYVIYRNGYGDSVRATSSVDGTLMFDFDEIGQHRIFVQEMESTHRLTGSKQGGDCYRIGTWDPSTRTCTLTRDVSETIEIASSSLTLKGNGYTIDPPHTTTGIYIGNQKHVTVKDASIHYVMTGIAIDNGTQITLRNNTITSAQAGIEAHNTEGLSVIDNFIADGQWDGYTLGIVARGEHLSEPTRIRGNTVTDRARGMYLQELSGAVFRENNIRNSGIGLIMDDVRHAVLRNNTFLDNKYHTQFTRLTRNTLDHDIDTSNTLDGAPWHYLIDAHATVIDGEHEDVGGFACIGCTSVQLTNVTLRNTGSSILLYNSASTTITNSSIDATRVGVRAGASDAISLNQVSITNSEYGARIQGGSHTIAETSFRANDTGLRLQSVQNSDITENTFASNTTAIEAIGTRSNEIFRNNFLGSGKLKYLYMQDPDQQTTYARSLPIGGNYWSIYDQLTEGCADENSDGICDEPFPVQAFVMEQNEKRVIATDTAPWLRKNGWQRYKKKPGHSQCTVSETEYLSLPAHGDASIHCGVNKVKGVANKDTFEFRVIYTNQSNQAPEQIHLRVNDRALAMHTDRSADSSLQDGNYQNGEQFLATSTFSKGEHEYVFSVENKDGTTDKLNNPDIKISTGYSNIAFLPGIQASRLFVNEYGTENRLWEPARNRDAQLLELNKDGSSKRKGIYTKTGEDGALDEFQDIIDIYLPFFEDLREWKSQRIIADYGVLAYDWRYELGALLERGIRKDDKIYFGPQYATSSPYVLQRLAALASSSDSGKVTIVTHSMGGLVAKKILAELQADPQHPYHHLSEKIDTVVFVGTPHLGTPKAIASILHGLGQNYEYGGYALAKGETIRSLAINMPSAYTLLPSHAYFQQGNAPHSVIQFDDNLNKLDEHIIDFEEYENPIDTHEEVLHYLKGSDGRDRPAYDDLISPEVLRPDYITGVRELHEQIDTWHAPDGNADGKADYDVINIAGWGVPNTLEGIEYTAIEKERWDCENSVSVGSCGTYIEYVPDVQPIYTNDGDGTVAFASAAQMPGADKYFVDLEQYNRREFSFPQINHQFIFKMAELRKFIRDTVTGNAQSYVYVKKPEEIVRKAQKEYLQVSVFSPVTVDIKDNKGRHLRVEEGADNRIKEGIPNSYYEFFGHGQYLGVPLRSELTYETVFSATSSGFVTIEFETTSGDEVNEQQVYRNISVSTSTEIHATITGGKQPRQLAIDDDGDGSAERFALSESVRDSVTLELLKSEIQKSDLLAKRALVQKVGIAQRHYKRQRNRWAVRMLKNTERQIDVVNSSTKGSRIRGSVDQENINYLKAIIDALVLKIEENSNVRGGMRDTINDRLNRARKNTPHF